MSFKTRHPDFAAIEQHIRRAHAERAVTVATAFADGIVATVSGVRRLFGTAAAPAPKAGLVVKARVSTAAR
jgi:hypothetical protein